MREFGALSPKQDVGTQGSLLKRVQEECQSLVRDCRELSFRHKSSAVCRNSQRLWQNTQGLHAFQPDTPNTENGRKAPLLTKKLFVVNNCCCESRNWFSLLEWHWVYQPQYRADSMPRHSWLTQNRFHSLEHFGFLIIVLLLWFFIPFFAFILFHNCFYFF